MRPIVIVAAGQSNMVGWENANNGPFFTVPRVSIWDTAANQFRPSVNLSSEEYTVYCGAPANTIKTIGAGRNNLAVAFAYRLVRETGRQVYIVFNCTGGRHSQYWIGNGRNSADWVALNADLSQALSQVNASKIDFFLWQQGENDADDGDPAGTYKARLQTLRAQAMAESWWNEDTQLIVGKPCQQWNQPAYLAYLNAEIDAFGALGYENTGIAQSVNPAFGNAFPSTNATTDSIHFSGRSLYSLGYYRYWDAVRAKPTESRDTYAQSLRDEPEAPWPLSSYITAGPVPNYQTQNRRPPLFNLEPTIAKTGNRVWAAYTSNNVNASEGSGQFAKLTYNDLVSGRPAGAWKGQSSSVAESVDFIGSNCGGPKLWTAPDGALHVFMSASSTASVFDGIGGVWHSVCRFPEAQFPRFTRPRQISKYGWPNRPFRIGARWYLPVSNWRLTNGGGNPGFVPEHAGRWFFGIDWVNSRFTRAFVGGRETSNNSYDEHCVHLIGSSGAVRCSFRTLNGAFISDNVTGELDNLAAWSVPVAWSALGTNPATRHCVVNTPTGRAAIAYNNATTRTNLKLCLSTSDTTNITNYAVVLQAGNAAYPDVMIDGDDIWVVYDAGSDRSATRTIRLSIVSEQAMIAGTATPQQFVVDNGS